MSAPPSGTLQRLRIACSDQSTKGDMRVGLSSHSQHLPNPAGRSVVWMLCRMCRKGIPALPTIRFCSTVSQYILGLESLSAKCPCTGRRPNRLPQGHCESCLQSRLAGWTGCQSRSSRAIRSYITLPPLLTHGETKERLQLLLDIDHAWW